MMKGLVFVLLVATMALAMGEQLKMNSQSFIDEINSKQSFWVAGRNFAEDTPLSHFKALASLKGINNNPNYTLPMIKHQIRDDLPDSFDARSAWPKCGSINTIRDQGGCGSCWAFGAVEVMSDRLCVFSDGNIQFQFSPEELVSCCSECGSCNGGWMLQAFEYWQKTGIPSGGDEGSNQGCRPYTAASTGKTPDCNHRCVGSYGKEWKDDIRFGIAAYDITPSEHDMKHELVINGPIEVAFTVYEDFYNYKSGVYRHTSGGESGRHAVKVIGYGNENGENYWLVANSWGSGWGDNGLFKIKRGNNECGIEGNPVAGNPQT